MKRAVALLLMVACAFTLACGGLEYMHEAEAPQTVAADPASATIVFIRPSGWAGRRAYPILDQSGRFLGEVAGNHYFITKMPPGEYMFIAWSEGTPALKATVEAGKIYYIEVGVTIGAWSPRARLFAIGPSRKQWAELSEWLGETSLVVPNPDWQQKFADDRGDEVQEVVEKGIQNYSEYDEEAKGKRTIVPGDGVDAPVPATGG